MRLLSTLFIYYVSLNLFAQNLDSRFSKSDNSWRFEVGTSPTNIRNKSAPGFIYHEFTWNLNASVSYFDRIWFGVQGLVLFTDRSYGANPPQNYTIIGSMLRVDLAKTSKISVAVEASYNYGDYCTCENTEPYRLKGLSYLGFGGSIAMQIKRSRFNFEAGFYAYNILNKVDFKYVYTQYILGINYRFGEF